MSNIIVLEKCVCVPVIICKIANIIVEAYFPNATFSDDYHSEKVLAVFHWLSIFNQFLVVRCPPQLLYASCFLLSAYLTNIGRK